jgi:tetratricopeptide (TPR) repeat protein
MKHLRYILCFLLLLGGLAGYAQNADLETAYNCVQRGSIDSAKTFIDRAMKDKTLLNNAEAWYIRGFIYKELYKKYEVGNIKTKYRDTAIIDLFISTKLDTSSSNKDNNYSTIKFLAATYYNDAQPLMDSIHYLSSIKLYKKYRDIMKKMSLGNSLNVSDIEFYNALGDIYSNQFFNSATFNTERKYLDSAKKAFDFVLEVSPGNYHANYSIGRLYFNHAANIINNTPFDAPISTVDQNQDSCVHLARLALPYLKKAHELEPCKLEPIIGLKGCYYLLHDPDNFQKMDELEKKIRNHEPPCN